MTTIDSTLNKAVSEHMFSTLTKIPDLLTERNFKKKKESVFLWQKKTTVNKNKFTRYGNQTEETIIQMAIGERQFL